MNLRGPQKVLFVESGRGYGGSIFSLRRLVKNLDRSRYEPHVIAFHDAEPVARIQALGVPVTVLALVQPFAGPTSEERTILAQLRNYVSVYGNLGIDTLCNGLRLARYIARQHIAIVHLNNGILENLSAAAAARVTGRPCISHVRGTEPLTKVERYCAHWMSAIITLNRTVQSDYAAVIGGERVHLIHNGVDIEAFSSPQPEKIREELGIGPGVFAVGTFARLVEGKGIPELISAAARVVRRCPGARFFIVGDDPDAAKSFESSLRKQVSDLGLDSVVVFTGWRDDRIDVMAAMNLIVQVSTTFPEGMSLAPLEAMALAKPVIVTDIPGYEFTVDENRTGWVVPAGDVTALTARIEELALEPQRAVLLGHAAQEKALREFDVRLTAQRVQALYDQLLSNLSAGNAGHSDSHLPALSDAGAPARRD